MSYEYPLPLLDGILDTFKSQIGKDYEAYRNHVYRVVSFCNALQPLDDDSGKKIIIAGCFHDLGIWTAETFDYLEPSVNLARSYLVENAHQDWSEEITLMITQHHKITTYRGKFQNMVELFRQADWVDVSLGALQFGLQRDQIKQVQKSFPNKGFHKRLAQFTWREFKQRPFKPLPMMKW